MVVGNNEVVSARRCNLGAVDATICSRCIKFGNDCAGCIDDGTLVIASLFPDNGVITVAQQRDIRVGLIAKRCLIYLWITAL